jgi:endonuclease G
MSRGPQRNNALLILLILGRLVIPLLGRVPRRILVAVGCLLIVGTCLLGVVAVVGMRLLDRNPPYSDGSGATQPEHHDTEPEREPPPSTADASIHLLMGNPNGATDDSEHHDNYLMRKPYFALSYNNAKGTPNWVSWCLKKSDLGPVQRSPRFQFRPDPKLQELKKEGAGFNVVSTNDYAGFGFDRGHMCPFGDRTSTEEAAESTFVFTNMIPQAPACNQRAWADLEDYCRELVRKEHQTLYIVSGPEGKGGFGRKDEEIVPADIIGHAEKVTVPAKCWKVILALEDGKGDAEDVNRVSRKSRVIAVEMPNDERDEGLHRGWAHYRKSAKEVEAKTGYHFFDRVPAAIIEPLKARVDDEHIPPPHHRKSED